MGGVDDVDEVEEGARSAKPVEIYGFVLWIATYVTYLLFILWAFVPEHLMRRVGVTYYPAKYWALSMPAYLCTTCVFLLGFYLALNMAMTNPLQSRFCYTDKFSVPMLKAPRRSGNVNFEEIREIPIEIVNKLLYQSDLYSPTNSN